MTKRFAIFSVIVFLVISIAACKKQAPVPQPKPELKPVIEKSAWIVFDQYPIKADQETANIMGLSKVTLENPLRVFNCVNRKKNLWKSEILPTGTIVLVQENGIPVYKADCQNKLYVPITLVPDPAPTPTPASRAKSNGWSRLGEFLKNLLAAMVWAAAVILVLALLGVLAWALWNLLRLIFSARTPPAGTTTPRTTTPPPPATPTTTPTTPATPTTPVTPPAPTAPTSSNVSFSIAPDGTVQVTGSGLRNFSTETVGKSVKVRATLKTP